jgi:hypothetical protein
LRKYKYSPPRQPCRLVAASQEAKVGFVADQPDAAHEAEGRGIRTVPRVVDDNDLHRHGRRVLGDRGQAAQCERHLSVTGNEDRNHRIVRQLQHQRFRVDLHNRLGRFQLRYHPPQPPGTQPVAGMDMKLKRRGPPQQKHAAPKLFRHERGAVLQRPRECKRMPQQAVDRSGEVNPENAERLAHARRPRSGSPLVRSEGLRNR